MFTQDFAVDFSGLSPGQINLLEKQGGLTPQKQANIRYYTLPDICILRVFYILKRQGLPCLAAKNAFACLQAIVAETPLSAYVLLHNQKEVVAVINGADVFKPAAQWGPLLQAGGVQLLAVGTELEETKTRVNSYIKKIKAPATALRAVTPLA